MATFDAMARKRNFSIGYSDILRPLVKNNNDKEERKIEREREREKERERVVAYIVWSWLEPLSIFSPRSLCMRAREEDARLSRG